MKNNVVESYLKPMHERVNSYYGKAVVIRDARKHTTYLRSYQTIVCKIVNGKFFRTWDDFSVTTLRHVDEFRRQNNLPGISKKEWSAMPVVKV